MNVIQELEKSLPIVERLFDKTTWRQFAACDYEAISFGFPEISGAVQKYFLKPNADVTKALLALGFDNRQDMCDFVMKYLYAKMHETFGISS